MSAGLSINQTINKLKKLSNTLNNQKQKYLFFPTQSMEKRIKERVFVKGLSTRGFSRKYSSQSWKLIRAQRGRQIAFVDLFYQGDSFADNNSNPPSLWRTVVTRMAGDKVQMGVDNDFNYFEKLAQEERFRRDTMLAPNGQELVFLADLVEFSIDFVIDQALT
jgi:hypothetical protein